MVKKKEFFIEVHNTPGLIYVS